MNAKKQQNLSQGDNVDVKTQGTRSKNVSPADLTMGSPPNDVKTDSGSADKTMKTDTQGSPSPLQQKDIIDKD